MATNPTLKELKKALGKQYKIRNIDFERCLYRDYGNGFNAEISGVSRSRSSGSATIYLWYGNDIIIKTAYGVERTAKAIGRAADELYEYSQSLIENGYTDRDSLFRLKYNM